VNGPDQNSVERAYAVALHMSGAPMDDCVNAYPKVAAIAGVSQERAFRISTSGVGARLQGHFLFRAAQRQAQYNRPLASSALSISSAWRGRAWVTPDN